MKTIYLSPSFLSCFRFRKFPSRTDKTNKIKISTLKNVNVNYTNRPHTDYSRYTIVVVVLIYYSVQ